MTVYTAIRDYVKKHRKGILVTTVIAGGSYFAGKYATSKIKEIQEKATADRLAKENLKRRFQQNQSDCIFTVKSYLPTLSDQILNEFKTETDWKKFEESRKLEKIEENLKKERENAALLKEEEDSIKQLLSDEANATTSESIVLVESEDSPSTEAEGKIQVESIEEKDSKEKAEARSLKSPVFNRLNESGDLNSSIGSLSSSVGSEEEHTLPAGILTNSEKKALMKKIGIETFTRTFTSIYSVTLLMLLTKIQLNLLGRFIYVWSVSVLNKSEPNIRLQQEGKEADNGFIDFKTERIYHGFSHWLLHVGWKRCADRVQKAVNEIVGNIPLKETMNYMQTETLMIRLRKSIEFDAQGNPFSYRSWMLPDTAEEELEMIRDAGFETDYSLIKDSQISLRRLIDETKDFIDSPDFQQVMSSCLDKAFSVFDHNVFATNLLPQLEPSSIREITYAEAVMMEKEKKMPFTKLFPCINRQTHLIIAGNEYLDALLYVKELEAFSALIYTQYGDEIAA